MSAFNHLKAVRNKHMVHDVNAYAQSHVAAVLNDAKSSPSVAALLKCAAVLQTLDQTQHATFQRLLNKAADWVTAQSQILYDAIGRSRLEATLYEELITRPDLVANTVTIDDVHIRCQR